MKGITRICEQLKLTPRAVRFYDESGLISSRRDRRNNRVFDYQAQQDLALIAALREAEVPLRDIRRILQAAESGHDRQLELARRLLARKRDEFLAKAERAAAVAEQLAEPVNRPRPPGQLRSFSDERGKAYV